MVTTVALLALSGSDSAMATDKPPRRPPQVRVRIDPNLSATRRFSGSAEAVTLSQRAIRMMGIIRAMAMMLRISGSTEADDATDGPTAPQ